MNSNSPNSTIDNQVDNNKNLPKENNPPMIINPKEHNFQIKTFKKEENQKIINNSLTPRLPEQYLDLSYDNISNK